MADFNEDTVNAVWEKGTIIPEYNKDLYRQDACGAWMMRSEYGNEESILGWQIDHVFPAAHGGGDDINNLRPMQHQNNRSKSDDYPTYMGVIKADGNRNVEKKIQYTVNEGLQDILNKLYKIPK